jgi:hypothetical protein
MKSVKSHLPNVGYCFILRAHEGFPSLQSEAPFVMGRALSSTIGMTGYGKGGPLRSSCNQESWLSLILEGGGRGVPYTKKDAPKTPN